MIWDTFIEKFRISWSLNFQNVLVVIRRIAIIFDIDRAGWYLLWLMKPQAKWNVPLTSESKKFSMNALRTFWCSHSPLFCFSRTLKHVHPNCMIHTFGNYSIMLCAQPHNERGKLSTKNCESITSPSFSFEWLQFDVNQFCFAIN